MKLFEAINRMDRIHQLIRREATGSPEEFAERFNLKRRQLYNILDEFKDYGADIKYCRVKNSFYYENEFTVLVKISTTPLPDDDGTDFWGGCNGAYQPFSIINIERIFEEKY